MIKFFLGAIVGFGIGAASAGIAAQLVGGDGFLMGYDVTMNGETICTDPYIWAGIHEIDCD